MQSHMPAAAAAAAAMATFDCCTVAVAAAIRSSLGFTPSLLLRRCSHLPAVCCCCCCWSSNRSNCSYSWSGVGSNTSSHRTLSAVDRHAIDAHDTNVCKNTPSHELLLLSNTLNSQVHITTRHVRRLFPPIG